LERLNDQPSIFWLLLSNFVDLLAAARRAPDFGNVTKSPQAEATNEQAMPEVPTRHMPPVDIAADLCVIFTSFENSESGDFIHDDMRNAE
jgi:hypothetical protein